MSDKHAPFPPHHNIPPWDYKTRLRLQKEHELAEYGKKVRRFVRIFVLISLVALAALTGFGMMLLGPMHWHLDNREELDAWLSFQLPDNARDFHYHSYGEFDQAVWIRFSISPDDMNAFMAELKLQGAELTKSKYLRSCMYLVSTWTGDKCKTESWWNVEDDFAQAEITSLRIPEQPGSTFIDLLIDKNQQHEWTVYMEIRRNTPW